MTQIHVLRLFWLLPIFLLAGLFEVAMTGALFAFCLAFATSKLFPVIEIKKETE
jgi:hypothetical protein